jgi:phage head maturation protease
LRCREEEPRRSREALKGARIDDLIATREHDRSKLLGRHPTTLTVEDRDDAFEWAVELPSSPVGDDVRVAVERADLRSTSWRMVVARDRWEGDVRHVESIGELRDVTVTAASAYGDAAPAERRTQPDPALGKEDTMAHTAEHIESTTSTSGVEDSSAPAEDRAAPAGGGLHVEDRVTVTGTRARGLADEFRAAGWPGEIATIPSQTYEDRAIT